MSLLVSTALPLQSDGKHGEYGIENTWQALIKAHRSDVKAFCITIHHEARDY